MTVLWSDGVADLSCCRLPTGRAQRNSLRNNQPDPRCNDPDPAELKDEPLDRGDSLPFPLATDYEAVVSAALEAVRAVELEFVEDYQVNDSTWMILCEKINWGGGGEVVRKYDSDAVARVVVQRLGEEQTAVRVISRRTDPLAGWEKGDYSQDIFAALIKKLEAKPQHPGPHRPRGARLSCRSPGVTVLLGHPSPSQEGAT